MDISDNWKQLLWNIDINDESRYRQEGVQAGGIFSERSMMET